MKFKKFVCNLFLYPIVSLLQTFTTGYNPLEFYHTKIFKNLNNTRLGHPIIEKGWILSNHKTNHSIIFDSYTTQSVPYLNIKDGLNLGFYTLLLFFTNKLLLTKTKLCLFQTDPLRGGEYDRIVLYYPQDVNILYHIYTGSPLTPVQIVFTNDKFIEKNFTYVSRPIIPSDYKIFEDFITAILKTWTYSCRQSYIAEKRFIHYPH